MKKVVEIKDSNFDITIRKPKNFDWIKTGKPVDEKTFVSDLHIPTNEGGIAWLVEPPAICPYPYEWISKNFDRYKYVLTYSEELLSKGNNFLFYPFGNTLLENESWNLYENEKNKIVSMMISNKSWTEGHKFRHNIKNNFTKKIDFYGSGIYGEYQPKINSCKNYFFQVVVENSKYEYYFTEKIIDCFLTGVIPIYWGSSKVLDFFDENGILFFNSEEELSDILNSLSESLYLEKISSVRNNFELCKNYTYSEDWIYKNYNFLF